MSFEGLDLNFMPVGKIKSKTVEYKTFCFTGACNAGKRDDLKRMIEDAGGRVLSSVTHGLDYLVTDHLESGSTKMRKAQQLGTTIISSAELMRMLN